MSAENPEEFHELTTRELAASDALNPLDSRPEYAQGKEKLSFEYQFSTGEILDASEDNNGVAHVRITRNGEPILDFQDFLPDFRFLTPTGIMKAGLGAPGQPYGEFGSEPRQINVGDMRDPRSILLLLHEIGHGRNLSARKEYDRDRLMWERYEEATGRSAETSHDELAGLTKEISESERNAWAECLKLARQIKQRQGIDVLEMFNNVDELQEFISAALISYREVTGDEMISFDDRSLRKNIAAATQEGLWGNNTHTTEQWQLMKKFFDKDRLKRKLVRELQ